MSKRQKKDSGPTWDTLPEVLMRLVLVCLQAVDWDACHQTCWSWAALARKITWPRQLVVRGSGKFREVRLRLSSRLAVLHVPNFFKRPARRQRFLISDDGVLGLGLSPEYETTRLAQIMPSLWCVQRLSAVNVRGKGNLARLLQLPNLEQVRLRRSSPLATSMLKSQRLELVEVDRCRVVFDSGGERLYKLRVSRSVGDWYAARQLASLSVEAYQADIDRSQNRVFPPQLTVTWSRCDTVWDTVNLEDGPWLADDSFRQVQDLTLRVRSSAFRYLGLGRLPCLRRLCLVKGKLNVRSLPIGLETLGLHHVTILDGGADSDQSFCSASVVSVRECEFQGDALHALTYRLNAVRNLTLTDMALVLGMSVERLQLLRLARPFSDQYLSLFALSQVPRVVLLGPREADFSQTARLAIVDWAQELEIRGVPKRERRIWTDLSPNAHKIVFK
jgi:hypothetical protein